MYKFDEERHVHILDGAPLYGTSTVIKEVMPPFLAKWGAQCAVDNIRAKGVYIDTLQNPELQEDAAMRELGRTLNNKWFISNEVLDESVSAWSKVRKDAATKGTDMHKDLEDYVQMCIDNFGGTPQVGEQFTGQVGKFAEWANDNVQQFIFTEKNTYSKETWTGGVVDCMARLHTGELAVIDFKSSPVAYFNQFLQAAGYAMQLEESGYGNTDGSEWKQLMRLNAHEDKEDEPISAIIVVPFGAKNLKPEKITNLKDFKQEFIHCVSIYKLLQAFKNR